MFLAKSNVGHKTAGLTIGHQYDVGLDGALGVARHSGIVSPAYGVYRPLAGCGLMPRFADHLLRTPTYAGEYLGVRQA